MMTDLLSVVPQYQLMIKIMKQNIILLLLYITTCLALMMIMVIYNNDDIVLLLYHSPLPHHQVSNIKGFIGLPIRAADGKAIRVPI